MSYNKKSTQEVIMKETLELSTGVALGFLFGYLVTQILAEQPKLSLKKRLLLRRN
jgi:hypothetical protein